ncbi:protein IMPACT-like isoform X2 [Pomacea canaliculata]|uniref:protein IMPACT-like isoform X2 n=1 Tax=Pomacea canaliculata TaxID=400727 RepID=UPI000D73FAEC|nr:protein IMPACT-like isoform X2 [Pomacea canaliculata]
MLCAVYYADEVEALSAIYGDEWCVIDEEAHIFCIRVSDQTQNGKWTLSIQIHLPDDYPLQSPPQFQLNAPWLRGMERTNLESKLSQVYCDNLGEDLIYLWVEAVREFLQKKADYAEVDTNSSEWKSQRVSVQTQEADDADDGFDLSLLEGVLTSSLEDVEDKHEEYECPKINHGEIITDRRSTFQPHLAVVFFKQQVRQVLEKLIQNKKIANATHNMYAYRIVHHEGSTPSIFQGCDDDGETHAGSRMLHLLQIVNAENVMVVVSRWFGGIHLGPDRFKHINNCTRSILESHGYLAQREDKKGPRSGKKRK